MVMVSADCKTLGPKGLQPALSNKCFVLLRVSLRYQPPYVTRVSWVPLVCAQPVGVLFGGAT